jgi:hypothetical protein
MAVGGHGKTRQRRTAVQVEEDELKEKAKKIAKAKAKKLAISRAQLS